jgi:DNA-binding NarL/FixJ family response regulator
MSVEAPGQREILSARELEMLLAASEGLSNSAIGERLGLEEPTVKNAFIEIFRKFKVKNRTGAVIRAIVSGLIDIDPLPPEITQNVGLDYKDRVFLMMLGKKTPDQIAADFNIPIRTTSVFAGRLYQKLGVADRTQAVVRGLELKAITLDQIATVPDRLEE